VSSWKWVAKRVKHLIWVAMCLGVSEDLERQRESRDQGVGRIARIPKKRSRDKEDSGIEEGDSLADSPC
jgi:hypothetical protein